LLCAGRKFIGNSDGRDASGYGIPQSVGYNKVIVENGSMVAMTQQKEEIERDSTACAFERRWRVLGRDAKGRGNL
jgi:hypothetical protein